MVGGLCMMRGPNACGNKVHVRWLRMPKGVALQGLLDREEYVVLGAKQSKCLCLRVVHCIFLVDLVFLGTHNTNNNRKTLNTTDSFLCNTGAPCSAAIVLSQQHAST